MRPTIKSLGVVLVALLVLSSCGSDSPDSAIVESTTDAADEEMAD